MGLVLMIGLIAIIVVMIAIFFIFYLITDRPAIEPNANIVFNLTPLIDNHSVLIEKEVKRNHNGRLRCVVVPRDYYFKYKDILKKRFLKYEEKVITIPQNRREVLIKGDPSNRNLVVYLPKSYIDLPSKFRNSEFGSYFKMIEQKELEDDYILRDKLRTNKLSKVMLDVERLPEQVLIANIKDIIKDAIQSSQVKQQQQKPERYYM